MTPPTPTVLPSDELSVAVRSALQRRLSAAAVELHEEGGGDDSEDDFQLL